MTAANHPHPCCVDDEDGTLGDCRLAVSHDIQCACGAWVKDWQDACPDCRADIIVEVCKACEALFVPTQLARYSESHCYECNTCGWGPEPDDDCGEDAHAYWVELMKEDRS